MQLRLAAALALAPAIFAATATTRLLQPPAMSRTHIVFSYARDLWSVPRQGGVATRLTAGVGAGSYAIFSPDGATIAFSGEYGGNVDVFTIPASGGVPKRITHHPPRGVGSASAVR
jgi:tricorn protease